MQNLTAQVKKHKTALTLLLLGALALLLAAVWDTQCNQGIRHPVACPLLEFGMEAISDQQDQLEWQATATAESKANRPTPTAASMATPSDANG